MADLTASKKKNKAQLWEEAKRKEEEEAKNRLMRFRSGAARFGALSPSPQIAGG